MRSLAEQQAERETVVRQRIAAVNAEIDGYLATVTYSAIPPLDAPADYEPLSKERAALLLLIRKEQQYIETLRALTAEWRDNWQAAPSDVQQALAWIASYEKTVEGKVSDG